MRRASFAMLVLTIFGLASFQGLRAVGAPKPEPTPPVGEPRLVAVSQALVQISQEARKTWAKNKTLPEHECNFAQRKNWRVDQAELLAALSRKVNPEPAIDAYVRWQLLSFGPEWDKVDAE